MKRILGVICACTLFSLSVLAQAPTRVGNPGELTFLNGKFWQWDRTSSSWANVQTSNTSTASSVTAFTPRGSAFPSPCANGDTFVRTDQAAGANVYVCDTNNTYQSIGTPVTTFDQRLTSVFSVLNTSYASAVHIRIFGDSISRCWGAAGNAQSACAGIGPTNQSSLWVEQLRGYLSTHYGGSHGSGFVSIASGVANGSTTVDAGNWTLAGTPTPLSFAGPVQDGLGTIYQLASTSDTLTFASRLAKSFNIVYVTGADSCPGFTVKIDGTSQGTFGNTCQPTLTGLTVNVPAPGGIGMHTLQIVGISAHSYIAGAESLANDNGVAVDNFSLGGCQATCWGAVSGNTLISDAVKTGAQLDVISLGVNEAIHGIDPNTYYNALLAFVQHEQALSTHPTVVLLNQNWIGPGAQGLSANYYTKAQAVATATGAILYDPTQSLWVSYNNELTNTWINSTDTIHLTDVGQNVLSNWVLNKVFGTGRLP